MQGFFISTFKGTLKKLVKNVFCRLQFKDPPTDRYVNSEGRRS